MNSYENLLQIAKDEYITVHECFDLNGTTKEEYRLRGLYIDNNIALDRTLDNDIERSCILAEELGHYYTSSGDILDLTDVRNRKQERKARLWAYDKQIGLIGIINAFKAHHDTIYDIADYLDVSEDFLQEALECYRQIYGIGTMVDNYLIKFEPNLRIYSYHCID